MNIEETPLISAIDLFCGAGGLTHGMISEGIVVRAGVDIEESCKYPFEQNNEGTEFVPKDIKELQSSELIHFYNDGEIRLLAGCAPCQPFSTFTYAHKKKKKKNEKNVEDIKDEKWSLLYSFARLAKEVKPDILTMENVPQLVKHQVFNDFVKELEDEKYFVSYEVVDCAKYGMPQRRRRLVLFASRKGKIKLLSPKEIYFEKNSVKKVIGNLPKIEAGKTDSEDSLHKARNLSPLNLERIEASVPGGTWKDWDEKLLPTCYKKETGESFSSVYGRMKWDEPSPTITTQFYTYGTGRFGHPEQNRALSLREGAILQTFPDNYSFVPEGEPFSFEKLGMLIGNAVPVDLGKIIGRSIVNHVKQFDWTT